MMTLLEGLARVRVRCFAAIHDNRKAGQRYRYFHSGRRCWDLPALLIGDASRALTYIWMRLRCAWQGVDLVLTAYSAYPQRLKSALSGLLHRPALAHLPSSHRSKLSSDMTWNVAWRNGWKKVPWQLPPRYARLEHREATESRSTSAKQTQHNHPVLSNTDHLAVRGIPQKNRHFWKQAIYW